MADLTARERQDVENLMKLLEAISRFLKWLVFESGLIPDQLRPQFMDVFTVVEQRLFEAANRLNDVKDNESEIWRRLDDAGLIGAPLDLKLAIWRHAVADTAHPRHQGFLGRAVKPFLTLVNSLLGSLAKVFPFLDLVSEYKEGAEVVIDEQRRGGPVPMGGFNVR